MSAALKIAAPCCREKIFGRAAGEKNDVRAVPSRRFLEVCVAYFLGDVALICAQKGGFFEKIYKMSIRKTPPHGHAVKSRRHTKPRHAVFSERYGAARCGCGRRTALIPTTYYKYAFNVPLS